MLSRSPFLLLPVPRQLRHHILVFMTLITLIISASTSVSFGLRSSSSNITITSSIRPYLDPNFLGLQVKLSLSDNNNTNSNNNNNSSSTSMFLVTAEIQEGISLDAMAGLNDLLQLSSSMGHNYSIVRKARITKALSTAFPSVVVLHVIANQSLIVFNIPVYSAGLKKDVASLHYYDCSYVLTVSVYDASNASSSLRIGYAEISIPPIQLPQEIMVSNISSVSTNTSITHSWQPPSSAVYDFSKQSILYHVRVFFDVCGNGALLTSLESSSSEVHLPNELLLLNGSGSIDVYSNTYTLSGCYRQQRSSSSGVASMHCITPWTVYQFVIETNTTQSSPMIYYAATQEGLLLLSSVVPFVPSIALVQQTTLIIVRNYIPLP